SDATDDTTMSANSGAQTTRASGILRRKSAISRHSAVVADKMKALASSAAAVAESSTSENVTRLRHIRAAPAPAAIALSHVSTSTLSHAGENSSRARS